MSYLAHSLKGEELVLDSGTLWRAARALDDAEAALTPIPDLYLELLQHPAVSVLKDNAMLRTRLIAAVDAEQKLTLAQTQLGLMGLFQRKNRKALQQRIPGLTEARDAAWREYEMMRKLSVRDGNRTLMLHRSKAPPR